MEAKTDLEGLRAVDSNEDGVFDGADEKCQSFGLWQDKNSNGQSEDDEFATLEESGITAIKLSSNEQFAEVDGNTVFGQTTFEKADGSTGGQPTSACWANQLR